MKKLRILHLAATMTGGVGLNILLLARLLDRNRFDVSAAFASGSPLDSDLSEEGIKVYPLRLERSPWSLRNIYGFIDLMKLLRKEKFDIVHTHTSVGGFVGRIAAWLCNVPVVMWTIHGWAFNYPGGGRIRRYFFILIEKLLDALTDHYVAVCANMKDIGVKASVSKGDKISVIYHGIETSKYDAANRYPERRKELALGGGKVVGSAGRFELQKAMDDFLRAAAFVKEKVPGTRFLLIGEGPLGEDLKTLSLQLGLKDDTIFSGWKKNIDEYIGVMDVFCMSSLWEAMPFMLLEAMAMGKPVVATAVGGIPEALEDGLGGFVVPPGSPGLIGSAIVKLLEDEEMETGMGRRNRERVEELFSLKTMIAKYEELYEKLYSGKS